MPSAENLTPEGRFVGLFVGKSGSGKKTAACSFPHPIKYFDFDGRIRGILGADWIDRKDINYDYYPPRSAGNNPLPVFQKLNDDLAGLLAQCQTGQCPYKTVIVASLTGMTFDFIMDAMPLTHGMGKDNKNKGKRLGVLNMPGPEDYGFEANGTYQVMSFLRSLPIPNIIVMAHVIDRYGKADPNDDYSERIVVGEKISLRDKISENVQVYFDHIFKFDKSMVNQFEHYTCQFRSDIARTTFKDLPNGVVDITKRDFYKGIMAKVNPAEVEALVKP